mmetsp:Transcript_34116/g.70470  ORF Transcript_34116/g.70470 Transcript_34116/m.70470 type:complete len:604 (+) Transcript_34116:181-1992(+)
MGFKRRNIFFCLIIRCTVALHHHALNSGMLIRDRSQGSISMQKSERLASGSSRSQLRGDIIRIRGGSQGEADSDLDASVAVPTKNSNDDSVLSDENLEVSTESPVRRVSLYLARTLSTSFHQADAMVNSSFTAELPSTVEKILKQEIRDIAASTLNVTTAEEAQVLAGRGAAVPWVPHPVKVDTPPAKLSLLGVALLLLKQWLPTLLMYGGSCCFLMAGIKLMEKVGTPGTSPTQHQTMWERTMVFWGVKKAPEFRTYFPVVYVLAGYIFSHWLALCARRSFSSFMLIDQTTSIFLQTIVKYIVLILAGNSILKAMGYNIGLDNIVTSSSIAIGIASQSVLQNFAAGFAILLFRPFKVGDRVLIKEHVGTVTKVMLYETVVLTDDGRTLIFPNREISSAVIENYTTMGMRRVQVSVFTAASSNIAATRAALVEVMEEYAHLYRAGSSGEEEEQRLAAKGGKEGDEQQGTKTSEQGQGKNGSEEESTEEDDDAGLKRSPSMAVLQRVLDNSKEGLLQKMMKHLDADGSRGTKDLVSAVSADVLRQIRVLWDRNDIFAACPSPPACFLLSITETQGYHWRVHVWCKAREHDGWYVTITEAIAKKT